MDGFHRTLDELWERAAPRSVLDVGCGEGVLTHEWAERLGDGRIVGIDLDDPKLRAEWDDAPAAEPRVPRRGGHARSPSPTPSSTWPRRSRCSSTCPSPRRRWPRWRAWPSGPAGVGPARAAVARTEHGPRRLLARARQHAGAREPLVQALVRAPPLAPRDGRGGALAVPVDHAARSPVGQPGSRRRMRRAAPRSSRWGSAPPGLVTYAYFSLASHSLSESEYGGITLLWSAVFITVSVLYRPVEQLLSRTIADRDARGRRAPSTCAWRPRSSWRSACCSRWWRSLLRGPIQDDLFDGSATLYWILIVAVLAYAVSYFARGFLAGHRRFGLYGGLVLMESCSRCAVRARGGGRDRRGPVRRGARHGRGADRLAGGGAAAPSATAHLPRRGGARSRAARRRRRTSRPQRAGVHARPRHRLRGGGARDHARRADLPQRRARCW